MTKKAKTSLALRPTTGPHTWRRFGTPRTTQVYDTLWRFAAERQRILRRRLQGETPPWTTDSILARYRFTNAYRASDRVSQYLIRNVIYDRAWDSQDLILRILLFKIFNRIETWEYLRQHVGEISCDTFDVEQFGELLSKARGSGSKIYSAAYIMPPPGRVCAYAEKHRNHLALLELMLMNGIHAAVERAQSLCEVYRVLRNYPGLGRFLAFQYSIDLNYSTLTDFDEMDFVVAGPGARDGLAKCFANVNDYDETDLIKYVADRQEREFESRELSFDGIGNRRLQLIDCQNLFCEVAKYARLRHPEVAGTTGRSRIKQLYRPLSQPMALWFPPKWGVHDGFPASNRRPATPNPFASATTKRSAPSHKTTQVE
jgi:hypothetical protein